MEDIVIRIPRKLKPLIGPLQDLVAHLEQAVDRAGKTSAPMDYADLELEVAKNSAAIERTAHGVLLAEMDVDTEQVVIDGRVHTRVGRHEASYYTLAGEVRVERSIYRENGRRNAKTVDPVSLRAGVVAGGWLPRAARAMAFEMEGGTSREAEARAREMGRLPYSRSSFEAVGHSVCRLYVKEHDRVGGALMKRFEVPKEACSASVSADRVAMPMEEPRKRPVGRPGKKAPKRPVERVFRMAWCGTVTLHDEEGEAIHTIRYGRMPGGSGLEMCEAMADDVVDMLMKKPALKVTLLADGGADVWKAMSEVLDEERLGVEELMRLIDFWHLIEKLGSAARVIFGETEASGRLQKWKMRLLNKSHAAMTILSELRSSGCEDVRVGDSRPVHEAITYIENNADRMDYASARRKGLPIGSGNVEATCKSLVATRMKRAGSRWKETTGDEILQARALALSDRWGEAMDLTLSPLRKAVRRSA